MRSVAVRQGGELVNLQTSATELGTLLNSVGLDDLVRRAEAEAVHLEAGACELAVLGEFKRGKSSLINALIGVDLLPVAALPLTAVGTRVQFGETVRATVELLDGARLEILPGAIADFATERGNPGNERRVAGVTVTAPAAVLSGGLRLIDTPGIGSAFADVSATAGLLLAAADAALVVLSAEQPATRQELDFVRQVLETGMPVFLVENKIDLVPAEERAGVVDFVCRLVGSTRSGRASDVFVVSSACARRAQRAGDSAALAASGLPALERALLSFAGHDRLATLARAARSRLLSLIDEALARLALAQQIQPTVRAWQQRRDAGLRWTVDIELFRELRDSKSHLEDRADNLTRSLWARTGQCASRVEAAVEALWRERPKRSPRRWTITVETRLFEALHEVLNQWSEQERQILAEAADGLRADWHDRAVELLTPIVGRFEPPAGPAATFEPPSLTLPLRRLSTWPLLPGRLGYWQVRRRAGRWLRKVLPVLCDARRSAVAERIRVGLRRAEEQYYEEVRARTQDLRRRHRATSQTGSDGYHLSINELQRLRRSVERVDG